MYYPYIDIKVSAVIGSCECMLCPVLVHSNSELVAGNNEGGGS